MSRCACVLLIALGLVGCGSSGGNETVRGNVSFRGQPITNGGLTFFPGKGRPVSAAIQSDGQYSVELPPGDYDVVVSLGFEKPPGWKEGDPLPPQKIVLPVQYTVRAKTTLKATVAPGQAEPINFELK